MNRGPFLVFQKVGLDGKRETKKFYGVGLNSLEGKLNHMSVDSGHFFAIIL